jgi:hypothetical protein
MQKISIILQKTGSAAKNQVTNHGLFSIGGCIRLRLRYAVTTKTEVKIFHNN